MSADGHGTPPLQFSIKALLGVTAALAVILGTMKWLGVSPQTSTIVLVVLAVAAVAAIGLIIAIAGSGPED